MKKIFCFIFARGGSKRIKNKNLIKIKNKSLLKISIDIAKKINTINKIIVSSDSVKIINEAKKNKVNYILRPKKLCTSKSNEFESWKHAIKYFEDKNINFDYFLSLPTTAPLRKVTDINKLISTFKRKKFDLMFCVTKTNRYPNYNMVKKNKKSLQILSKEKINKKKIFDMTTVGYISTPRFIKNSNNIFDGKVGCIEIPRERSLDIDDSFDLKVARFLYK
jgi:CMP-N-acetylneuraminic acid synthetase